MRVNVVQATGVVVVLRVVNKGELSSGSSVQEMHARWGAAEKLDKIIADDQRAVQRGVDMAAVVRKNEPLDLRILDPDPPCFVPVTAPDVFPKRIPPAEPARLSLQVHGLLHRIPDVSPT
jgi:hypothetical protein